MKGDKMHWGGEREKSGRDALLATSVVNALLCGMTKTDATDSMEMVHRIYQQSSVVCTIVDKKK